MPPKGCQAELIKFTTSQPSRQSLNISDWSEILHGPLIYHSEPGNQRKKWFWTLFIFSIRPNILSLSISGSQDSWTFLSEIFHQQSLQPHCLPEVGWFITTEILRNTRPSSTLEPLRRTCKTLQSNINNNNKELQDCQYIDDMVVTKNSIRWLSASSSIYMLIVIAKLQDVSCYFQLCDLPPWTEWLWLFLSGSWLQNRVRKTEFLPVKINCIINCSSYDSPLFRLNSLSSLPMLVNIRWTR